MNETEPSRGSLFDAIHSSRGMEHCLGSRPNNQKRLPPAGGKRGALWCKPAIRRPTTILSVSLSPSAVRESLVGYCDPVAQF